MEQKPRCTDAFAPLTYAFLVILFNKRTEIFRAYYCFPNQTGPNPLFFTSECSRMLTPGRSIFIQMIAMSLSELPSPNSTQSTKKDSEAIRVSIPIPSASESSYYLSAPGSIQEDPADSLRRGPSALFFSSSSRYKSKQADTICSVRDASYVP